MRRFIYGEDPASQNDFHGITIHELLEMTMDDETPTPLLQYIYAIRNTSFDKILQFHTDVSFRNSHHFTWSLITPMKEPSQNDDSRLEKIE